MDGRENYNDLYTFMTVASEGSFTRAAERLGVAQSGVSRTVRDLEARLGVRLLTRTTRRLSLTQAGERLFQAARQSFQTLDDGLALLAHYRSAPSGTVRINASQHAVDKLLLPKLAHFGERYPDIRLELISESRFVDIVEERFDAGIRLGGEVDENMVAVQISAGMEMAVVGTPGHFRRYGFPQTVADLAAHPCIAYQTGGNRPYTWEFADGSLHRPQGQWAFSDSYMETAAAKLGLGLAYVPLDMVAGELEQGSLIRVLQAQSHRFGGWHIYYPHRNISPALRLVVDALKV